LLDRAQVFHICPSLQESQLPLYLRPYEVLVTSNRTALIEMVPDTLSLHQLKAKSPIGTSLADHFFAKFIQAGSSRALFDNTLALFSPPLRKTADLRFPANSLAASR